MGKDLTERILWKQYESEKIAEKIANEAIITAMWQSDLTSYLTEMTKIEFKMMFEDLDIQDFPDAEVCIKIAKWRANDIIEQEKRDDIKMDAYIQLRDMLSKLKIENGLIMNPENPGFEKEEKEIIYLYNNPEQLREKFRSRILDLLLRVYVIVAQDEELAYSQFRKRLFPYLPPYDVNPN